MPASRSTSILIRFLLSTSDNRQEDDEDEPGEEEPGAGCGEDDLGPDKEPPDIVALLPEPEGIPEPLFGWCGSAATITFSREPQTSWPCNT